MAKFLGFNIGRSPKRPKRRTAPTLLPRAYAVGKYSSDVRGGANHYSGFTYSSTTSRNQSVARALLKLRSAVRQEYEQNDHVAKAVRYLRRNIVGRGIEMRSLAKSKDAARELERHWRRWGQANKPWSCDVGGRLSWNGIEDLVAATLPVDGESLLVEHRLGDYGLRLEVVDASRLDVNHNVPASQSPNGNAIIMGVEVNRFGRPLAYHILDSLDHFDLKPSTKANRSRIMADRVIHIFVPEFPGQVRGVPWMAPTSVRWALLRDYEDSELKAAVKNAKMLGVVSHDDDYDPPINRDSDYGDEYDEDGEKKDPPPKEPMVELGDVSLINEDIGETIKPFEGQSPNNNFDSFYSSMLRAASAGADVPYHAMTNDTNKLNFSSIRAINLEQQDMFRWIQRLMIEHLHGPVFERWMDTAVTIPGGLAGRTPPDELLEVEWVPRSYENVQPREEARANEIHVKLGLKSRSEIIRGRGRDPEKVFKEIAQEQEMFAELGIEEIMNQPFGDADTEADEQPGETSIDGPDQ